MNESALGKMDSLDPDFQEAEAHKKKGLWESCLLSEERRLVVGKQCIAFIS